MCDLLLSLHIKQYKTIVESGLVSYGNNLEDSLFKPPVGAWPCLGTQPCYKAPAELCI